jgi:two-component system nitrate/nitrite response regulator NarL
VTVTVRVFVIAEVRLYREGIALDLERRGRFSIVGTSDDVASCGGEILGAMADVVLLCATEAEPSFAFRELVDHLRGIPVVALAVPDNPREALAWVEAGAAAFLTCEASLDDLAATVEHAACGEAILSPKMVGSLVRRLGALAQYSTDDPTHERRALTTREREVVHLIADGMSNREIARTLHIEVTTVKNHVHHVLEKLQVGRRSDAPRAAGLVRRRGVA